MNQKDETIARQWLKRFASVRDPKLRSHAALRILDESKAFELVIGFSYMLTRSGGMFPKVDEALDAFLDAMTQEGALSYDSRRSLYTEAMECSLDVVARLFLELDAGEDDDVPATRSVVPGQKALSRGERKSLARAHRVDLIRALTQDPDPMVVEILLENPHLTEDDVVRMAAKRPTSAVCQALIYKAPKWRARYHVKLALAKNPNTSIPVAIRSMVTLRTKDLKDISKDGKVPDVFREQAEGLVDLRESELKSVH